MGSPRRCSAERAEPGSRMVLVRLAAGAVAVVTLSAGCSGQSDPPRAAPSSVETTGVGATPTASPSAPAGPVLIDVAALPAGDPPRVDALASGVLVHDGRSITTDFPSDAAYVQILGEVDGEVIVVGDLPEQPYVGERFWAIGEDGHARRLGGAYPSYTYGPRLVESTGHLWVHHEDRTTPRTIWELDARTGEELASYPRNEVPRGLARADQALVDAWVQRRDVVPDTSARSPDGALRAATESVNPAAGVSGDSVVVTRVSDGRGMGTFDFPRGDDGVDRVVFEDADHLLVLVTVSYARRTGFQQAIVRCSVVGGACERATDIGGSMALGVVRPDFASAR